LKKKRERIKNNKNKKFEQVQKHQNGKKNVDDNI